jgi:hypothetical protein
LNLRCWLVLEDCDRLDMGLHGNGMISLHGLDWRVVLDILRWNQVTGRG